MSLMDKIRGLREGLNSSVYKRVWEHSPSLADMLVSDVRMPRITGRGILNTAMVGIAYFIMSCCGNDDHRKPVTSYQCSNGIDDDGDGHTDMADQYCSSATDNDESPFDDLIAPGVMENLEAYASVNNGEETRLRWVSSGDDDWIGTPSYFEIRYSANAINNETDWLNAASLGTVTATGPSGTQYDQFFPVGAGTWYFTIKAVDEANNKSPVSNSPTATIKSKPEFFVDRWLAPNGFNLNYGESSLIFRGDAAKGINANADALAQILINSDAQSGSSWIDLGFTWEGIRDLLLLYTDGQPVVAGNQELVDVNEATMLNSSMNYGCNIWVYDPPTGGVVAKTQAFNNLTGGEYGEWNAVYNLHRNALIQIVSAFPADYGNLDPSFNPTW